MLAGNVTDVDAAPLSGIAVTAVDSSNGYWQYTTDGGSTWNDLGSPDTAHARLLTDDALTSVRFVPDLDFNGTVAGITFRAWDQSAGTAGSTADVSANGGITAFSAATATANINITAVNDPPIAVIPGAQTTDEDTNLVFSSANGNPITFIDVDAGSSNVEITLNATNGTVTLPSLTGLTLVTGDGTNDNLIVFDATILAANTALDGLIFTPNPNFNGAAQLGVIVDDLGNTGIGGDQTDTETIPISVGAVDDAPVITAPATQEFNEDNSLVFTAGAGNGISVNDIDVNEGTGILQFTLTATHGRLTLSDVTGLTFIHGDGTADSTMTFTGTQADINAALEGPQLRPRPELQRPRDHSARRQRSGQHRRRRPAHRQPHDQSHDRSGQRGADQHRPRRADHQRRQPPHLLQRQRQRDFHRRR